MGAECCTASSTSNAHQVLEEPTERTSIENQELQQKKKEDQHLKTNFYGKAGVLCSKTMTSQKHPRLDNITHQYQDHILPKDLRTKNNAGLEMIGEMPQQINNPLVQLSTDQLIEEAADQYMGVIAEIQPTETERIA